MTGSPTASKAARILAAGLAALAWAMAPPALAQEAQAAAPAAPAQRVLTLAPHATEMVFAAGGGERIVGTIRYSDHPPAASRLPRVGDVWQIDLESLLALHPDLVVAWLPGPVLPLQPVLSEAGIPVFFTAPATLDDIAIDIEKLGSLMGTGDVAGAAARQLRERLSESAHYRFDAKHCSRREMSEPRQGRCGTQGVQGGVHRLYEMPEGVRSGGDYRDKLPRRH